MRAIRSLAVVASAVALGACPTARMHVPAARLELSVAPAAITHGDTLRLTATLTNPGERPLRMEFDDECQVVFYVLAPDRSIVHPPGSGAACVGAPAVIELAPGQARRFEDRWIAALGGEGTFMAYAILWEHHVPDGKEREYRAGYRSNEVTVQVTRPTAQ